MDFGAAWYPEHWPESRWPEDVRLMRAAGMNVCRIGEFAWSSMEPTEGRYQLDWLERAVGLLHDHGIATVLGTPTAAPPAWLTHHHPDTLAIEPDGRPAQHGNRCHTAPTSTTYQKYCRRIVEQLAKRFGQDARVIGWQIDNEYNRVDYSDNSHRMFQAFLKEQYGTIESLNTHWSTAYWSQTYQSWDEIPLPIGPHNPGLMLAFRHFVTKTWRDFQKLQIDSLRLYCRPEQWITHNFMGWFDVFDHYPLAQDLDFVSWDWYISTGHHDYLRTGAVHDLTRGLKRRNFWLMETQPGNVNWSGVNNMLNRGEARCMAFHAIAHGADALLYWQWRSAPGGQEQLHGSLLGADGRPRPFYAEAKQIGADFAAVTEALRDTTLQNEVALLHSYDARWSINFQRHHKEFDPVAHLLSYYRPLAVRNVGADIISAEAPLEGYKLVIAPSLVALSEPTVQQLTKFVEGGGTLVLTVRCGQKDVHNALFPALQPGPLRELAGVEVEEYYPLDEPVPVEAFWASYITEEEKARRRAKFGNLQLEPPLPVPYPEYTMGQARIWAERLRPLSEPTQTLARYGVSNGWLDGGPAVTHHPIGNLGGKVIYIGAWLDDTLQDDLTGWLLEQAQVSPLFTGAAEGVEVARRVGSDGRAVYLVINHNRAEKTLNLSAPLPDPARDLLTDQTFQTTFSMPGYGVCVIQ